MFFHCSKQVLNWSILMPFSASAVFLFHLFHIGRTFTFEDFFHLEKQNKSYSGWDQVSREGGAQKSCCFGQKLLKTQCGVGRCAHKSCIMKWLKHKLTERVLKKNSLKPNTAPHKASWCIDTDGFPEHSPSGESLNLKGPPLQKIIPVLGGSPLVYVYFMYVYVCVYSYPRHIIHPLWKIHTHFILCLLIFLFWFLIFFFLERRIGKEKERKRNINVK